MHVIPIGLTIRQACWIPIIKGKKLILAGDPMQLPPTILSQGKHESSSTKDKKAAPAGQTKKPVATQKKKEAPAPKEDEDVSKSESDSDSESSSENSETPPQKTGETLSKGKTTSKKQSTPYPRPLKPPRSLEVTMFERLEKMYGPSIKRMLEVQYRFVCSPLSEFL